jgi:3-oxoacyl-[acyl-carrier protein] reductase
MSTSDLLKGKVALITGCNRGIGKAIMETFAQNGADIWACTRKQTNEFDELLQELRTKYSNRITPLYFDLADESAIKETLNPLLLAKERIDILVNNAGVAHGSFFQMTSISKMKELFEINFFSQLLVTQIVAKLMMRQKSGSIINLASIAGIDGNPGYVSYGSGKAALIYATKSIAKEFAPNNVRVNAIAPGLTETAMADQMEEKAKTLMINSSAMNRLAQPQEIANTALFLASDLSQFITGQVIRVDGGS